MKKIVLILIVALIAFPIFSCEKKKPLISAKDVVNAPPPAPPISMLEATALNESGAASMDRDGAGWYRQDFNTESYDRIFENKYLLVKNEPLSTFSVDVDTASYSNVRRFLNGGALPPKDAVRIEELINYFSYDYPEPEGDAPFSINVEIAACPWNTEHRLARIGLKGETLSEDQRPVNNLVFLLDVSGSMNSPNKLGLLKKSFALLLDQLDEDDSVAIVVYAGASGLVLRPTKCDHRREILGALQRLEAGGSTNGGAGIELAYKIARQNFLEYGNNRVILATDGDFNIGVTNQGDLTRLIEEKAESGVFLTVLGFGMGNYKDSTLEKLADLGNGNYAYIDNYREAQKVFAEQLTGTLYTIAKDVKLQIEFNPAVVQAYRLVGYENRVLENEDFNDDKKDAGDIGSGHTVTAFYEIVPVGAEMDFGDRQVDDLKYQQNTQNTAAAGSGELMTVAMRYKQPDGHKSSRIEVAVKDSDQDFEDASPDFKFAGAVAAFGMLLRDSEYKGNTTFEYVLEIAKEAKGADPYGYRSEFIELIRMAKDLS